MGFYIKAFNDIKSHKISKKKEIKDSSIKDYLRNIRKISKELFNSAKPNVLYFADHESVIEYLENITNCFSRKVMLTSIIVLIDSAVNFDEKIKKIYREYLKKLANENDAVYKENEKNTKEEENWITRKDIQDKIDNLEISIKKDSFTKRQRADVFQQYLVLNLYFLLPPVRNDYTKVKIVNDPLLEKDIDLNFNYINLFNNTLYLCNYKTAKFYGTQKILIPEPLLEMIKKYQIIKKENLDYTEPFMLINTTNNTQMNSNTLTKYLNKIFKPKKVSTTILRKVYLSEKYPITHSMNEMDIDAAVMGHDINTARKIYTKKL
jgi:integrase